MDIDADKKVGREESIRKYLLTDVSTCTFTYNDGLKSKVHSSPDKEIVLVKLIPRTSNTKSFESLVLRNYSSAKTVDDLAKMCRYDCLRTFTRHFKKCFEQTPYQWLLDRKMEEIYSLVLKSDITITEIARIFDFKSVSHLVHAFSKRFGISPYKCRLSNTI